MIILDGQRMLQRTEAHAYLKEKLLFPDYYGGNLDALYDCLTELPPVQVQFIHEDENNVCYRQIRRIFADASRENPELVIVEE